MSSVNRKILLKESMHIVYKVSATVISALARSSLYEGQQVYSLPQEAVYSGGLSLGTRCTHKMQINV